LHIENVAVIKTVDIDLGEGLCVLTGETGAGKSLLIDSVSFLTGGRVSRDLIRSGEDKALVSGLFSPPTGEAAEALNALGVDLPEGDSLLLQRTITRDGRSTARINGRAVNQSILREVGALLINIHGQSDNQKLMQKSEHIALLDAYSRDEALFAAYCETYAAWKTVREKITSLRRDESERLRTREMLEFQVRDIDSAKLREGEEEALEAIVAKLRAAERINKCCLLVQKALEGGKGMGAIYLTDRASGALESISDAMPEAQKLAERLAEVKYELEDIAASAAALADIGDGDPSARLDKAEGRLAVIERVKRKYGETVAEVLEFRADAARKLELIDNADDRKAELEDELRNVRARARELARELSVRRRKAAHGLKTSVTEILAFLDVPKVTFEVSLGSGAQLNAHGIDEVEFLICTNVGDQLMPLSKIASGGELARIMLSLKNVLNLSDGIETVIFDEIDTGISGKTSRKVGIKLKEIGKTSQVICVTHSAQIASLANSHVFISKSEKDGRTESAVRYLDREERVREIARILGGIEITDAQITAAREMIAEGENY
jgi:DNA repair protein RecN (Recombination protein N)